MPLAAVLIAVLTVLSSTISLATSSQELKCSSDTVALLGQLTNFTFTYNNGQVFEGVVDCGGGGLIIGLSLGTDQQLRERNISWYQETGKFTIQILATADNNNTEVYGLIDSTYKTDTLQLIVVASPPGPPVAPSVTVTNLTALTLTWTAPWPHPVTNYTVTMLNLTSNQITQWTTCDEQLVLRGGGGQCDELVFTVEAETDVGSTGPSTNTTGGFPRGLTSGNSNLSSRAECTNASLNTGFIDLRVTGLQSCEYEQLSYEYKLSGIQTMVTSCNKSNYTFENISCNVQYEVTAIIRNEVGEMISITKSVDLFQSLQTTITITSSHPVSSSTPTPMTTTAVLSSSFTSTASPSNTMGAAPASGQIAVIVSIATVVPAVILLVLIIISIVIILLMFFLLKKRNENNSHLPVKSAPSSQNWANNPTYDTSTAHDPTYEEIPWGEPPPIRSLPPSPGPNSSWQQHQPVTPRSVGSRAHMLFPVSPAHSHSSDEYITMTSVCNGNDLVRYSRSPGKILQ